MAHCEYAALTILPHRHSIHPISPGHTSMDPPTTPGQNSDLLAGLDLSLLVNYTIFLCILHFGEDKALGPILPKANNNNVDLLQLAVLNSLLASFTPIHPRACFQNAHIIPIPLAGGRDSPLTPIGNTGAGVPVLLF